MARLKREAKNAANDQVDLVEEEEDFGDDDDTDSDQPLPDEDLSDFESEADEQDLEIDKVVELSQKEQNARALATRRAIEKRIEERELDDDLDYLDLDD
ncbi:MAG: hypothetical protein QF921_07790 [Pseudomonadales bacterium]|jgi:hypothetical protein|nr:hypothetical protein [Pseudomonadales bacterium]MDP6473177.1 hypothetical protein [Pseudomonadales bacterium]MDP6826064.1 hypothetical protein [Pseudomonadales bacterium]MDP6971401.1 hypothetical protein [Pseudomonadales bacterium]|tara:strand:- start:22 stop:318 length:297 start_codon:yes stop_codon:yes gene_type:complete